MREALDRVMEMLDLSPSMKRYRTNNKIKDAFECSQGKPLESLRVSAKFQKDCKRSPNPPRHYPNTIKDYEVKGRTMFVTRDVMLGYIVIIINGKLDEIKKNKLLLLTWFEEWLLNFEIKYGK